MRLTPLLFSFLVPCLAAASESLHDHIHLHSHAHIVPLLTRFLQTPDLTDAGLERRAHDSVQASLPSLPPPPPFLKSCPRPPHPPPRRPATPIMPTSTINTTITSHTTHRPRPELARQASRAKVRQKRSHTNPSPAPLPVPVPKMEETHQLPPPTNPAASFKTAQASTWTWHGVAW